MKLGVPLVSASNSFFYEIQCDADPNIAIADPNSANCDSRLRQRLMAIEKLEPVEKCQVLQLPDALIERGYLKCQFEENHAQAVELVTL